MAMEFWGVEVKAGQPLKVQPQYGRLVHISQAALGVVKDAKAAKYVPLKLKVDSKDFVIGSLAAEERPQLMFDLVFEKEFELSHDWKNGSVYFLGYTADDGEDEDVFSDFDDESEDEPVDIPEIETGKVPAKSEDVKAAKPAAAAAAAGGKPGAKKEEQPDSDEDEDDSETLSSDDEGAMDLSGGDYEDSDESEEEEEELPKVQQSKKRPAEPVQKTPVPAKKPKAATPDKTGNKKGHASTPYPSKGAGKSPAGNKSNGQGPKSGGFKGKRGGK